MKPIENTSTPYLKMDIRLNRFIANAGVCSRRNADKLIAEGHIKVNNKTVREMGVKVKRTDTVSYKGKPITPESYRYVLLNKPKDYVTTTHDPQARKTVMDLVKKACVERIYPVGRLDRDTTGLLLLTNDGETAKKLTHPSHKVKKIYRIELNKPITQEDFHKILDGLSLEDGPASAHALAVIDSDNKALGIEMHIGRNRIVRRMFAHLGYEVRKLDRVMFGSLTKKNLPRGKYRHLTHREILAIKGGRFK